MFNKRAITKYCFFILFKNGYYINSGDLMKKIIWFICLFLPFFVFAYSDYIIPGGDTLGIEVNSKGIVVVGFYKVNGEYINDDLKVGDKIVEVNDKEVNSTTELVNIINKSIDNSKVMIKVLRNDVDFSTKLELKLSNGTYKTGLYVKSSILGIGTLSYIDPGTNVYGVLGHSLNLSETNKLIDIREGYSYDAKVTSFTRSVDGNPGSKNAEISKSNLFGTIESNSNYGIFGKTDSINNRKAMKVGQIDEIKIGDAYIYTTNLDNKIDKYRIKILEVNKSEYDKNIYFEIVDKELLEMSGGIVQGMSGSPIIQDNMIIGAVTRVLVDDVSRGYGISIVTMLEEGDKLK